MPDRWFKKFLLWGIVCGSAVWFSSSIGYAQEAAQLRSFNLDKSDQSFLINIEHSKSPADVDIQSIEQPRRLIITITGARVTFKPYENIPIEIPINDSGIRRIVVEERKGYGAVPTRSVVVSVEMTQPYTYSVDSQWSGQYLQVRITPQSEAERQLVLSERETDMGPSPKITKIKQFKDAEISEAKEHFDSFTQQKRIELIRKESQSRLTQVRSDAQERMDSGKTLEAAYKKLKAETEVSALQTASSQIPETRLYTDITVPSQAKPMLRRALPTTNIVRIEDCINTALSHYLPVQIAQEQMQLAQLRVREARRAFYPGLLAEWNEIDGDTVSEPYRGRSYAVQAEQPFFTGGKLIATLRKEQLGEVIARGNLDRIKQDMIVQVTKAYYELVFAKNSLDGMFRLKESEARWLKQVEQEIAVQAATTTELLAAQSTYNQVCYQVAYSEQSYAKARLELEKAMYTENINVDMVNTHLQRKNLDITLAECLDLAFQNRVELKVLDNTIKAAKFTQDIIRSEEMPNVSMVGTYGRSGEAFSERDLNLATEWSLMGKVKWFLGGNSIESYYKKEKISPYKVVKTDTNVDTQTLNAKFAFWDNLAHFTKQKEAQISRTQALKDLEEMKNKIRQETEEAYFSFKKYKTQLALAINEIGYRRKQLEIVKTKRLINDGTVPDIMDAELQLEQANAHLQEALAGVNVSIVTLNRAVGVINYFQ